MGKFDQLRAIKIIQYSVQWSTLNWSKYYNLFGFDHESKTILMIDFDWIINNEYKFQSNFDPVLETEQKTWLNALNQFPTRIYESWYNA